MKSNTAGDILTNALFFSFLMLALSCNPKISKMSEGPLNPDSPPDPKDKKMWPLLAHPQNPRYFTYDNEKVSCILNRFSHLEQPSGWKLISPPKAFDFDGYLDFLKKKNLNFIRLWRLELFKYQSRGCPSHPVFPDLLFYISLM